MDLLELGARSMDLVDLEFLELGCLAGKKWSGAVFVDLELLELSQTHPNSDFWLDCHVMSDRTSCMHIKNRNN
jgi:hypothetical protein